MAINFTKVVLRRLDQVNHTVENAWLVWCAGDGGLFHGLHVTSSSYCLGSAFLIPALRQEGRAGEVANAPSAEAEVLHPHGPVFAASSHGWWRLRE